MVIKKRREYLNQPNSDFNFPGMSAQQIADANTPTTLKNGLTGRDVMSRYAENVFNKRRQDSNARLNALDNRYLNTGQYSPEQISNIQRMRGWNPESPDVLAARLPMERQATRAAFLAEKSSNDAVPKNIMLEQQAKELANQGVGLANQTTTMKNQNIPIEQGILNERGTITNKGMITEQDIARANAEAERAKMAAETVQIQNKPAPEIPNETEKRAYLKETAIEYRKAALTARQQGNIEDANRFDNMAQQAEQQAFGMETPLVAPQVADTPQGNSVVQQSFLADRAKKRYENLKFSIEQSLASNFTGRLADKQDISMFLDMIKQQLAQIQDPEEQRQFRAMLMSDETIRSLIFDDDFQVPQYSNEYDATNRKFANKVNPANWFVDVVDPSYAQQVEEARKLLRGY